MERQVASGLLVGRVHAVRTRAGKIAVPMASYIKDWLTRCGDRLESC